MGAARYLATARRERLDITACHGDRIDAPFGPRGRANGVASCPPAPLRRVGSGRPDAVASIQAAPLLPPDARRRVASMERSLSGVFDDMVASRICPSEPSGPDRADGEIVPSQQTDHPASAPVRSGRRGHARHKGRRPGS